MRTLAYTVTFGSKESLGLRQGVQHLQPYRRFSCATTTAPASRRTTGITGHPVLSGLNSALSLYVPFKLAATRTHVMEDCKSQSQRVVQSYDRIWSMFAVIVDGWPWQQQTRVELTQKGNGFDSYLKCHK
jgi:hypothetical protein